jgi:hypothetical protein
MRWARDATLLQDASFYSPVELSGPSVSSQQEKGLCVEFLNGNGMNFMLFQEVLALLFLLHRENADFSILMKDIFQEALLDVLQLVLEPPPPAVNAMSENSTAEYEGLQYGKFMVSETIELLDIIFSKLMQIEVHLASGQVLYCMCMNDWNLLFLGFCSCITWIDPLMLQLCLSLFCGVQSPRNCSQSSP